eukprot:1153297-Pelagomonas_calceolata.AAC.7
MLSRCPPLIMPAAALPKHFTWRPPLSMPPAAPTKTVPVTQCCHGARSGSTSPVENLAVLASLWRATAGDAPGAAFGVALATYLGLHPIILLVRVGHSGQRGQKY